MVEDCRDLVVELVRAEARFLIVGAHALGLHGVPRATLQIHDADFTRPATVVQLGLPPYRIDILTGVSGLAFEDAWNERIEELFEGVRVPFIGRAALIRNKRASGRTRDLADLEALGEG